MNLTGISFETALPLIGAAFTFFFGVFVWLKEPRRDVNILFLGFCVAITYWLFGTFQMFLNRGNLEAALFWDRFVYLGVVFVPSLMHHFSLAFTKKQGQRVLLVLSYVFSFVFLIISRTDYFLSGVNVFPNIIHGKAAVAHHVFLALFFLDASVMFYNIGQYIRKSVDRQARMQSWLVVVAFLNILLIGGTAYLPAYGVDISYPFSYFSGIFFVIITSLALIKGDMLESRVLIAEMFTFLTSLLFATNIALSQDLGQAVFTTISLMVFLYFGFSLIRTMKDERRRREQLQALALQLRKANEHLKEMDKVKSEFISIASHQLRTPISVIKGYLSLMLEGAYGKVDGPLREKIENMQTMNERLVEMINNMLNVSRIERNKMEYVCSVEDVVPAAEEIIGQLREKASAKGIVLVNAIKEPKLMAFIDPAKFREVLMNLVDNAIKYSPKGAVTVTALRRPRRKEVVITVQDEGIGMDAEMAAHTFEKFYRSSNPAVTRETGTGLGLYICGVFVRGMGGDIWVDRTAPGKGTSISFSVPTEPVPHGGHRHTKS